MQSATDRSLYRDRTAVSLYVAIAALLIGWRAMPRAYSPYPEMLLLLAIVLLVYVAGRPTAAHSANALRTWRWLAIIACVLVVATILLVIVLGHAGL